MSNFSFNQDDFDDWINQAMKAKEAQIQQLVDRLGRQCKGQPVEAVKTAMKREWARDLDGDLTDPHLTAYATAIAEGQPIEVRYTGIEL